MGKIYYLCNVICYDGDDSWVAKFILEEKDIKTMKLKISKKYGCAVLLIDKLYEMSKENVIAYINQEMSENERVKERFLEMYM